MKPTGKFFLAALFSGTLCAGSGAFDLYSDSGEQDGPEIRVLAPAPLLDAQTGRFFQFAKFFSPRLLQGKASEEDAAHFFTLLEHDPDSMEIMSLLFLISRNRADLRKKIFERFIRMARENPGARYLSVIAGERLFSQSEFSRAEPFLIHALPQFTAPDAMKKILGSKKNLPRQALFSLFCKHYVVLLRKRDWTALDNAEHFLAAHPELAGNPDFQQEMLLHLMECFEKTDDPAALLPFPVCSTASAARERLLRRIPPYLALFRRPDAEPANHTRAFDMLERLGKSQELLEPLLNSLLRNPDNKKSLLMLANLYASLERHADAAKTWENLLRLEENPPFFFRLEYIEQLRMAGFLRKAVATAESTRPMLPRDIRNSLDPVIIDMYLTLNALDTAKACADRLKPSFEKQHLTILILYRQKHYPEAREAALRTAEFIRKNTKNTEDTAAGQPGKSFWFLCAMAAEKCGDLASVEALLNPLLQENPGDPEVLNFIGYTFADHNYKLEQAQSMIEKALRTKPDSPEILDSMAWVLYRRKKFQKAHTFILKSIHSAQKEKSSGADAVMLDHAGDISLALGRASDAAAFWEKALRAESEDADYEGIRKKLRALKKNPPSAKMPEPGGKKAIP